MSFISVDTFPSESDPRHLARLAGRWQSPATLAARCLAEAEQVGFDAAGARPALPLSLAFFAIVLCGGEKRIFVSNSTQAMQL
jgi:hypothetical protein